MSDQERPDDPQRRISPLVALLMIAIGIVLLLPGLCSLILGGFMVVQLFTTGPVSEVFGILSSGVMPIWTFGLLIGAGGVALIARGVRR